MNQPQFANLSPPPELSEDADFDDFGREEDEDAAFQEDDFGRDEPETPGTLQIEDAAFQEDNFGRDEWETPVTVQIEDADFQEDDFGRDDDVEGEESSELSRQESLAFF